MSNFVIFEDTENLQVKSGPAFADAKRERQKLAPLTNKVTYNENALENQVRKEIHLPLFLLLMFRPFHSFISPAKVKSLPYHHHRWSVLHLSQETC